MLDGLGSQAFRDPEEEDLRGAGGPGARDEDGHQRLAIVDLTESRPGDAGAETEVGDEEQARDGVEREDDAGGALDARDADAGGGRGRSEPPPAPPTLSRRRQQQHKPRQEPSTDEEDERQQQQHPLPSSASPGPRPQQPPLPRPPPQPSSSSDPPLAERLRVIHAGLLVALRRQQQQQQQHQQSRSWLEDGAAPSAATAADARPAGLTPMVASLLASLERVAADAQGAATPEEAETRARRLHAEVAEADRAAALAARALRAAASAAADAEAAQAAAARAQRQAAALVAQACRRAGAAAGDDDDDDVAREPHRRRDGPAAAIGAEAALVAVVGAPAAAWATRPTRKRRLASHSDIRAGAGADDDEEAEGEAAGADQASPWPPPQVQPPPRRVRTVARSGSAGEAAGGAAARSKPRAPQLPTHAAASDGGDDGDGGLDGGDDGDDEWEGAARERQHQRRWPAPAAGGSRLPRPCPRPTSIRDLCAAEFHEAVALRRRLVESAGGYGTSLFRGVLANKRKGGEGGGGMWLAQTGTLVPKATTISAKRHQLEHQAAAAIDDELALRGDPRARMNAGLLATAAALRRAGYFDVPVGFGPPPPLPPSVTRAVAEALRPIEQLVPPRGAASAADDDDGAGGTAAAPAPPPPARAAAANGPGRALPPPPPAALSAAAPARPAAAAAPAGPAAAAAPAAPRAMSHRAVLHALERRRLHVHAF